MKLISLKFGGQKKQLKDIFSLDSAIRKIRKIIVISAYIDEESIDKLIKFLKKYKDNRVRPVLKIFTDRSSVISRMSSDSEYKLQKLNKQIEKFFRKDSGIYLVQKGKLFHSKLYLIEGNIRQRILIGSLNLTQKGLNENEEILADIIVNNRDRRNKFFVTQIEKYIDKLKNHKGTNKISSISKKNVHYSLRDLLLDGKIYYKTAEMDPFVFKLELPDDFVKEESTLHPLLESNVNNTISIKRLLIAPIEKGGLEEKKLQELYTKMKERKSMWKRYCVETCYGFWCPSCWDQELQAILNELKKRRTPFYKEIKKIIQERKVDLEKCFLNFCNIINQKINAKKTDYYWKYANQDCALERWTKWYENLNKKLENKDFLEKLITGVASVPVPDIWNDTYASSEFENSFCELLIYHWSKEYSKSTSNKIAQAVAAHLELEEEEKEDINVKKLKKKIISWMKKNPNKCLLRYEED
jgi:hypothetical protein